MWRQAIPFHSIAQVALLLRFNLSSDSNCISVRWAL